MSSTLNVIPSDEEVSDSDSDVGADENDCAGDDGADTDTVAQQPISRELVEQSLESTRSSEQ